MEPDLPTFARDAAACGNDLYTLLEIDALASESDIRRAFRKKALTAHPDKTGDAYDPIYYRRLERTRDVLLDTDARKLYDDGMRAVHEKRQRLGQMDARRRRLVEVLEAAENAAKRAKQQPKADERDPEREAMVAKGRKIAEERRRLMKEAEERERETERVKREAEKEREEAETSRAPKEETAAEAEGGDDYDKRIAELERRLKEKQQRKAEKKGKKVKGGVKDLTPPPPPPHDPPSPRAEAGGLKQPSETTAEPVPSAPIPHRPSAPPSAPADAGKGRFASTMARLRAAQAEKRRREEEAAKASAGPAEA
jgi:DnaJ homolog subfamily C member 17